VVGAPACAHSQPCAFATDRSARDKDPDDMTVRRALLSTADEKVDRNAPALLVAQP
jgi:hypothetical protein